MKRTTFLDISKPKRTIRAAGLMSGTSADGVDAAIVDISRRGVKLLAFATVPYPPPVRRAVLELASAEAARVDDICHYNFVLGELFADALIHLAGRAGLPLPSIDVIGSHGQTIRHLPHPRRSGRWRVRSTLQISEPSIIAERTGITTVADFRPRDVAAGGEGAPLVPYADYVLFAHRRISRAVQNIGGIANVTYLPAGGGVEDVVAFDTGPGNMVIDGIVELLTDSRRHMDRDGRLAARGRVHEALLAEWMANAYFSRRPPKSTGREEFGRAFCERLYRRAMRKHLVAADLVATVTALTAASIAEAYRRLLPGGVDEVILCGGGARNPALAGMLQQRLGRVRLRTTDEFGIDADAKEAVSFALLAAEAIRGAANNVPAATGAARRAVLGKIVPGEMRKA